MVTEKNWYQEILLNTQFGARLKEERKALGVSIKDFSALGGVEANAQGRYEKGARMPKSDYLMAIHRNGVDILYVLTGVRPAVTPGSLSAAETLLIERYRTLADEDKGAVTQITKSLSLA